MKMRNSHELHELTRSPQRKILDYAVGYKEFNEAERSIVHYITTPDRDRGGDVVNPFGMIDTDFSKSPTVFYNHRYMLPVAKSLWRKADDKGVLAKTQFSTVEYAQDIYRLHKEGIINTWSIGFRIPNNPDAVKYDEPSKTLFINIWELLEYSSAPIAMNPNCLDVEKNSDRIYKIDMIKGMCKSAEMCEELEMIKSEKINTAGIASKDIKEMFAGAISRITGRRIKM